MKKIWLGLLFLIGLIGAGGYFYFTNTPDDPLDENPQSLHSVTLTSNIDGASFAQSPEGILSLDMQITVIALEVSGYHFDHWIDVDTSTIVSISSTYTFTVSKNHNIRAVYLVDGTFGIYLFSNISEAALTQSGSGVYDDASTVSLSVSAPERFEFLYWYDYYNDEILSSEMIFDHVVDKSRHIVAVYQYLDDVRSYYQTGFENSSKSNYLILSIGVDGRLWEFDDALIGSLANDKKIDTKSVRIQNSGSIKTEFKIPYLYAINFWVASYGDDASATVLVEVSGDGITWIEIDSITSSNDLIEINVVIHEDWFEDNSINPELGVYVRIKKSLGNRVNIDNVSFDQQKIIVPELPQDRLDNEIIFPNNSTRLVLTIENMTEYYSYGDEWIGASCTVLDLITEEQKACQRHGEVNTNKLGEYQIVYYAIDDDGFTASQVFTKVVLRDASLLDYEYSEYYSGLKNLYGEDLLMALRNIITTGVTLKTYDEARQILEIADRDPLNLSNVLLIYNRWSVSGEWDAETWHREHVWPNSRLGVDRVSGSQRNIASDLHNLRAIDPSVNSGRSNKLFDYEATSITHYPAADRGDVARVYFYMVTMWEHLVLGDENPSDRPTYSVEGAVHGYLSALIDFHYDDTVDAFEINRNNVIYSYQNNRNPFIDYPHLVELIWFDHENIPLP